MLGIECLKIDGQQPVERYQESTPLERSVLRRAISTHYAPRDGILTAERESRTKEFTSCKLSTG